MDKIVLKDGTEYEILEGASIDNIKIEVDEFDKIKGIDEKFSSDNLKEVKFKVNDEITGSYINLVRQNISFIQKTVDITKAITSNDSSDETTNENKGITDTETSSTEDNSSANETETIKDGVEFTSEEIAATETSTEETPATTELVTTNEVDSTPPTKVIYVVTISLRESTEVELRLLALEEKTDSINASQEVTSNTVNEILTDIIPSLIVGADE